MEQQSVVTDLLTVTNTAEAGVRAEDLNCFEDYIVDIYEELYSKENVEILFEGAQGFGLDIDHGDYPYVTSSHCTTAAALLNGVPPQAIRNVWGVAKIYETYVGAKSFQPEGDVFDSLQVVGEEFGATTGRKRQCNWMNVQDLLKAVRMMVLQILSLKNGCFGTIGQWKFYNGNELMQFDTEHEVKSWLTSLSLSPTVSNIYFSE